MKDRDPLQEIEDALSFPVSADFCARVRQQVALEPVRRQRLFSPWLAVAAVAVLAAGAGVITTVRHLDVDVTKVSVPSTHPEPIVTVTPASSVVAIDARHPAAAFRTKRAKPFETVVPDDQLRALDRLLASMREGRATVPAQVSDVVVNDRGERVLRALVLEPLTLELLAGTPAEPSKSPGKDPNK